MRLLSQRYKKALVTTIMGFRTEDDIRKNGLVIFVKNHEDDAYKYIFNLYKKSKYVLILKVNKIGFQSTHYIIDSDEKMDNLKREIVNILDEQGEIWVINSSIKYCWRCRLSLSKTDDIIFEMAYSNDDHILNKIDNDKEVKYILYSFNNNIVIKTNLTEDEKKKTDFIISDIKKKYMKEINRVKEDMEILNLSSLSLDIRVDNGYDFHDFDVRYDNVEKVIDYYFQFYK